MKNQLSKLRHYGTGHSTKTVKQRTWEIVEVGKAGDTASRTFDVFIIILIALSVAAIVLESVPAFGVRYRTVFHWFEIFSIVIFSLEYLARVWSCTSDRKFKQGVRGRLSFVIQPMSVIDLLAILPALFTVWGLDFRFLRVLRIFRILRLSKLTRYSKSMQLLLRVFSRCWNELIVTLFAVCLVLIVASCLMYFAEHGSQPEAFPDIPNTMWWAVITITTVGYGDVFPTTIAGKLVTAVIALTGVCILAMPTAIIGSAFVEELQLARTSRRCPHCNEELD